MVENDYRGKEIDYSEYCEKICSEIILILFICCYNVILKIGKSRFKCVFFFYCCDDVDILFILVCYF